MKVLYVAHCTDLSGANNSLLQMIKELRDYHGIEPFVLYPKVYDATSRSIADVLRENNIDGLSHKMTCFQRVNINFVHKLYYLFLGTVYLIHILFLLRKQKFDLVHSNSSVIATGLYIAKLKHTSHVWHFREVASLSFGAKSILGEKYQRLIYHKSDKIIAISKNVCDEFKDIIPLERTIVIPNGIKPPVITHFPNYDSEVINICIVGRVESNKNQLEAVKAIAQLPHSLLSKIRLHIIGKSEGEYASRIHSYIVDNNLTDNVIIHGVRNDVNQMLQDMNVGLMLSRHEAFGRVTVEYMMHAVCVIASNTSANPEIIHDEDNGLLYEIGYPDELANKIKRLVEDRELMQRLSKKGYNDAMHNYLSRTNSDKVFDLYQSFND